MVWSLPLGSVGKIGAYIALESWLFGFRPCSGQGQFTINGLISNSAEILDGKLLTGIFAPSQIVFTTWRSWSTCLQGPCEWIDHDLQVLCVELEQILWLKLESSLFIFSPVRDQAIYCMPSSLILKCHDSWVIIPIIWVQNWQMHFKQQAKQFIWRVKMKQWLQVGATKLRKWRKLINLSVYASLCR